MKHSIIITAILCITVLEAVALFNGINGQIMTLVIGAIAGLGGYMIRGNK